MNAIMTSRLRVALIKLIKTEHWLEKFLGNSLLSPKSVGYGLTQAFTSGQDVPYQAVMSAVKSSIDRIEGLGELEKETMGLLNAQYDGVCFPVVVIDGKLFEYSMGSNGSRQLREIPMGALYWQGITKHDVFPVVFIVTRNAIEEFVKSALEATNVLLESFEQYAIAG